LPLSGSSAELAGVTNADRELLNQVNAVIEADIKVALAERDPGLLTMRELTQAAIQSAQTFGRERGLQ
jgi:hypothetical protein